MLEPAAVMRILGLGIVLLMLMLPAAAAALPPDTVAPERIPMAITQPITGLSVSAIVGGETQRRLPESGLILLAGSALLGLATIVRRSTRA